MNAFFATIDHYLGIIATIETIVLVVGIVCGTILWFRGIFPALLRLGNGLAKRKIALFAKGDNLTSLTHLLTDSALLKPKNLIPITKRDDIGRAESATMYLVVWSDWTEDIQAIFDMKPDRCALIVYAPYEGGRIPDDQMKMLDGKRHTAVTNFRGRLLNDIVASMITTSYEKK
jgi:hypothetical protein